MPISHVVSRLSTYYRRHGFRAVVSRVAQAVDRATFSNRTVLFYFDLASAISGPTDLPVSVVVERKKNEAELSPTDFQEFINFWNPKIARHEMKNRFGQGASLWMIKADGTLAGYGWTLRGRTIEPHFFRLGQEDVHLFDYYVAPPYRGRGLNPLLVIHILRNLAAESLGRTFIEVAEWNNSQLSSLRKTPFRRLGCARKLTIGRRTIVWWDPDLALDLESKGAISNPQVEMARKKSSSSSGLPI